MAEITSLGVHTPVALPYLVAEGLLPEDANQTHFHWETHVPDEGNESTDEELLATKNCVVWTQGNVIRQVYRFDLEGEDVVQAVLTRFPSSSATVSTSDTNSIFDGTAIDRGYGASNKRVAQPSPSPGSSLSRAVVIVLKTKAHIHFIQGSSHIVDLPFEVEKAFAVPHGLVLQRKATASQPLPPTPQVPAPPPNSFWSSQARPSSSYLQSPTLVKSFGGPQPYKPSPLGANSRLDTLFDSVFRSGDASAEDDVASLFTLSGPLSDLGVVTYSLQHHRPRISSKGSSGLSVEFEALDPSERVVYVSSTNELDGYKHSKTANDGPLTLLVTTNDETRTLTVWHAWYIDERSLASLLKQRKAHKAAKAKRRSSFMSANVATGATTPAVRARDGARESFAAGGASRLPGDAGPAAPSSRKPTRQEQEDEMAHQMDPDFQPATSQQTARENRRISSLNADARAGQHGTASFAGAGGRRNTSFGGPGERRSLGHRKSRGSTPGSMYGRSLGPDDDLMELDSSFDADDEESIDAVVRHIRATYEAASADGLLGGVDENFKRELVVQKIHSMAMSFGVSTESDTEAVKVLTLADPLPSRMAEIRHVGMYVHERASKELSGLQLNIRQRALCPRTKDTTKVAIPTLAGELKLGKCNDIAKLTDGESQALLSSNGLFLSPHITTPCPIQTGARYRARDSLRPSSSDLQADKETGQNRTLQGPSASGPQIQHAGGHGHYDEVEEDSIQHRRRLKLSPADSTVDELLRVCQIVLPETQAMMIHTIWISAHATLQEHPKSLSGTDVGIEWVAFAAALFVLLGCFVDPKERAALNVAKVAAGKHTSHERFSHLSQRQHVLRQCEAGPWASMLPCDGATGSASPSHIGSSGLNDRERFLPVSAWVAGVLMETPFFLSLGSLDLTAGEAANLLLALHVFLQEQKLSVLSSKLSTEPLAVMNSQLGGLLGLKAWSFEEGQYLSAEGTDSTRWTFLQSTFNDPPQLPLMDEPVSVFMWFEHAMKYRSIERYPSISDIASISQGMLASKETAAAAAVLTPRILSLSSMLTVTSSFTAKSTDVVEMMAQHDIGPEILETLPEAIAAPFKDAVAHCERRPPTSWPSSLLRLVGRDDIDLERPSASTPASKSPSSNSSVAKDVQAICNALDQQPHSAKTKEASRHAVSQLIFSEDRRLVEATSLMHYNSPQVVECPKQPDWSDAFHFEQQRRVLQWVTTRMIALPSGDGMLHFDSQTPLLTEKYHLSGFSNACVVQPMGHTLTADRSGLTEEKVNWAYFHAGVSAGLRISKNAKGIDTSWIAFNKPNELTNRHAGLLLALGLRGHLRHLAKWLAFKYLTPKHTVTSVGLLLGLSASYMGTMDGLITRMLSVHITRMLPPGAAELNVSSITQTAGLMGIGLLYFNTQHRRMSEIMLSEVEHMELEDPDSGPDPLRDESYRLAAGFALGFINLGKGRDLQGLSGMHLPERLLAVAVGSRPVSAVHVLDRATAGAIMGIALVYMKSGDRSIARKIDIPDTEAQFDHVRPDMLMLRAMAKHIILWDGISVSDPGVSFTERNLPPCYQHRFKIARPSLKSADVPFFNIVTGLVLALSLKYAGTGDEIARDEILSVLDYFYKAKGGSDASFYYDAKLTRATVRRCIDVVALAAATVMAGTGDLETFRYLRRLHGRTDHETPYGSHLAAHLAIGVLFLAGGTYSLGTSDLAVASLLCAFYPLFPTDVHDNHVHLQAFRHLWVFGAEARCLVVEDIDTQRPISMPITVSMKDGSVRSLISPCLLPELATIARVHTDDPSYWRVTLDFANNPKHLAHFRETQRISVRHCPPSEAHNTTFTATMAALNDVQISSQAAAHTATWRSIFDLPSFRDIDKADTELILPPNQQSSVNTDEHGTSVDDRLVLSQAAGGEDRDALWNLRMLFAWAEKAREDGDGSVRWMGDEVLDTLKARIEERTQGSAVEG